MKKFTLLLFTALSISCYCQSDINGIGRFKIGMDISIIDSLKNEGYKYKTFDKVLDAYSLGSNEFILHSFERKDNLKKQKADEIIFELKKSDEISDYGTFPFVDNKKTFLLKYYNIVNIPIDYMELNFYNNKLYEIKINENTELILALNTKYKNVITEVAGKTTTCTNAYREMTYQDLTIKNTYRDCENIRAYSALLIFYYECKREAANYITVCDNEISDNVFKLEKDMFMGKYNDSNRDKAQSLKKL